MIYNGESDLCNPVRNNGPVYQPQWRHHSSVGFQGPPPRPGPDLLLPRLRNPWRAGAGVASVVQAPANILPEILKKKDVSGWKLIFDKFKDCRHFSVLVRSLKLFSVQINIQNIHLWSRVANSSNVVYRIKVGIIQYNVQDFAEDNVMFRSGNYWSGSWSRWLTESSGRSGPPPQGPLSRRVTRLETTSSVMRKVGMTSVIIGHLLWH